MLREGGIPPIPLRKIPLKDVLRPKTLVFTLLVPFMVFWSIFTLLNAKTPFLDLWVKFLPEKLSGFSAKGFWKNDCLLRGYGGGGFWNCFEKLNNFITSKVMHKI